MSSGAHFCKIQAKIVPVDRLYFTVATGNLLLILLRSQRVPALGQATSRRPFRPPPKLASHLALRYLFRSQGLLLRHAVVMSAMIVICILAQRFHVQRVQHKSTESNALKSRSWFAGTGPTRHSSGSGSTWALAMPLIAFPGFHSCLQQCGSAGSSHSNLYLCSYCPASPPL